MMPEIIDYGIMHSLGMTLLHSLWQVLAVYIILRIVLSLLKSTDSSSKYNISAISMLVILGFAIITFSIYERMDNQDESLVFYHLTKFNETGSKEVMSYPIPLAHELGITPQKTILDYLPWFVLVYALGIIFLSFRLAFGLIYLKKYRYAGIVQISDDLEKLFLKLHKQLKIKRQVSIVESVLIQVPFVLGYLKPVVIVPAGILLNIPFNQVEVILAHELAHIKRNDFLINIIQSVVELLFFYHPFIYLISKHIRDERENCCDDIALNYCNDSTQYVNALANMESVRMNLSPSAIAFVKKKNSLLKRVSRILKPNVMKTKLSDRIFAGLIVVAGLSTILIMGAAALNNIPVDDQNVPTKDLSINLSNLYDKDVIISDSIVEFDDGKIITHRKNEKGKKEEIEMEFDNGELTEIIVDGKKVPEKDHHLYKDVVKSTLVEVKEAQKDIFDAQKELAEVDYEEFRRDIDEAMAELENINHEQIMREVEEGMAEAKAAMAEIDIEAIREEIAEAMEDIDIEGIRMEVEEAMREIDLENINLQIDSAMNSIDWEEIQFEIQQEIEDAKMSEKDMQEVMEAIESIDWDIIGGSINLGLDVAFQTLEGLDEIIGESVALGLGISEEVLLNLDETIFMALESVKSLNSEKLIKEIEEANLEIEREKEKLDTLEKDMEEALDKMEKK
ncbi:MAG: M48 family metalloprotease [Bacteroidales bacterium]|nr:M48 family metalloprotease [Bacteroidales bacterium]